MSLRSSAMAAAVCLGLGSAETVQQELADMPYADVETVIIGLPSAQRNAMTRPWTSEKFAKAWQTPFPSAFSADEISVLREWVAEGGGLALVYDHMPVSNAVEEFAAVFGVEVANGHAYDERELRWEGDSLSRREAGTAVFRRIDGTLAEDPITDGRSLAERIDSAALGGGAAFRLPPEGRPILTLGTSQGGVLRVGRGRLAVFSDAGILATHDEVAAGEPPWNGWEQQNPQLFLNTLCWLSGQIGPEQ